MNFSDYTTYLAAVADWKLRFAAQMVIIRRAKHERKEAHWEFAKFTQGRSLWNTSMDGNRYWELHRAMFTG
jgi:sulfur relay (sulfurtransferase) DsrC/TusE family protein